MRFYIETFGCTSNLGDSREASEAFMEAGHSPSGLEEADLIIVNTCAVTEKTEKKILKRLNELQGKNLVVAGCLPAARSEVLEGLRPCRVIGILSRSSVLELIYGLGEEDLSKALEKKDPDTALDKKDFGERAHPIIPASQPGPTQNDLCGIINVAEGCRGRCSYCLVRKARGALASRDPEDIARSVQAMAREGIVEIQLSAQDATAYGHDIGSSLPDLINRVCEVPGRFMVRVGMMNPGLAREMLQELSEAFQSQKVYKFLHLPVQSGSDRVLEAMARGYTARDFREVIGGFRKAVPDISITTDIIVGFPGETEEDFSETCALIKEASPDKVNVTKFSRRPGTPAFDLYDMPDRIKKERSRKATRLWMDIASRRNRAYQGRILEALVTERGRDGTVKARSRNYLGLVIAGPWKLGSILDVMVESSNPFYLTARALVENRDGRWDVNRIDIYI